MRKIFSIILFIISHLSFGQVLITGIDTTVTTASGYNVSRAVPTDLTITKSYFKSIYSGGSGFVLQAGDDDYGANSTNLDGAVITGNKIVYEGTTTGIHGVMAGYNLDYKIKHNYIDSSHLGVVHEGGYPTGDSMVNTNAYISYNIFKDNKNYSIVEKGYDNTLISNNTFVTDIATLYFIIVKSSDTGGFGPPYPVSKNTHIYNNIFYSTVNTVKAIMLGTSGDGAGTTDTIGFRCDYNIYYYTGTVDNEPIFEVYGSTYSWTEWRALGYDAHSVIVDPAFLDEISYVPSVRLDNGTDLGTGHAGGLDRDAIWAVGEYPDTVSQNGTWQAGAVIYTAGDVAVGNYYVAPNGDDAGAGTIGDPWLTWGKAFTTAAPGDTVYFRGGVYPMDVADGVGYLSINDGTVADTIKFWNYPGEVPILDCDLIRSTAHDGSHYAIRARSDYCWFRGLTIRNVWSYYTGMTGDTSNVECIAWKQNQNQHCIIENCNVYNTHGIGFEAAITYDQYYINCDSWNNCDSLADGTFAIPGNRGSGFSAVNITSQDGSTYYSGCRTWKCSDQGFVAGSYSYVEWDRCWAFNNGSLQGEGHGYKFAYWGTNPSVILKRTITNSIASDNRASGFNTNDQARSQAQEMHVYNNIAYRNGWESYESLGYGFIVWNMSDSEEDQLLRIFKNNISYDSEVAEVYAPAGAIYTHEYNSWDTPPGVTLSDADFVSVDSTGLTGARGADGSLPVLTFLHIAEGSDLIDAGLDILEYDGDGLLRVTNDLGAYAYSGASPDPPTLPLVTTSLTSTYSVLAVVAGNVTDDGGGTVSARGICYGTSINPTTSNSIVPSGSGTGAFSCTLHLAAGTTYYARAYATNGAGTNYGSNITITTPEMSMLLAPDGTVLVGDDKKVLKVN